jgi:[FeFe] hydrogenase (group B1/B3)
MSTIVTELTKIKRRVYTSLARLAIKDQLLEKIDDLPGIISTVDSPRYRCCEYKEQAILTERIKLALGFEPSVYKDKTLAEVAADVDHAQNSSRIIQVLSIACDRCPIDKFMVTDACRNCLAHSCVHVCSKNAIFIIDNRAFIDQSRCVECGRCHEACAFGAIHQNSRPCERSCAVNAIQADSNRKAAIDYDKCIGCGNCIVGCPFGAIGDQTRIVQVVRMLKDPHVRVQAVIAPSFVGQFGAKVAPGTVKAALHAMGFDQVYEAALGADMVALNEAHELLEKLEGGQPFMTSSCCPSFLHLIEKHFPQLADQASSTVSPMVALARSIKEADPEAKVVFIGPCITKKIEARKEGTVDAVLTFEELECILVGYGINLAEYQPVEEMGDASRQGRNFAYAGGLKGVVADLMKAEGHEDLLKPMQVDGVRNCMEALQKLAAGTLDCNFIEGMGCLGGCVGGPGSLSNGKVTAKLVQNYANQSAWKLASENESAEERKNDLAERMEREHAGTIQGDHQEE